MESKEDFQVFPWSTNDEFKSVASIILNLEFGSNLLYNIDFLQDLQWSERQLTVWRTKTSSAQHLYEIDATHSLVNCLIHEYLPKIVKMNREAQSKPEAIEDNSQSSIKDNSQSSIKDNSTTKKDSSQSSTSLNSLVELTNNLNRNYQLANELDDENPKNLLDLTSFSLLNEETISCLYANSVLKFFKMLSYYDIINGKVERLLSRSEANLVRICERLDFPKYIIEYRHRIAHNKLPSFDQLKLAAQIALDWIKRNYWLKYASQLDVQVKIKQQIHEQTTMLLTNLFEVDEVTVSRKANSRDKESKQQNELKKFGSIDQSQLSLLNDTLYDLLNENFYSTLRAITIYIVDSTKEHLNQFTDDRIRKWVEEDAENMNSFLSKQIDKRKKEQLVPNYILNSFRPIFNIINKQLTSVNQLLFYLYSIIEDQQIDLSTSAKVWFVQIVCSLINNLNLRSSNIIDKHQTVLTEFEKCFRLFDDQLHDLKWLHLFTMLIEQPIMDRLSLSLAKRFYPLVSFKYSRSKFSQICNLLSIYLDTNDSLSAKSKKKVKQDDVIYDLSGLNDCDKQINGDMEVDTIDCIGEQTEHLMKNLKSPPFKKRKPTKLIRSESNKLTSNDRKNVDSMRNDFDSDSKLDQQSNSHIQSDSLQQNSKDHTKCNQVDNQVSNEINNETKNRTDNQMSDQTDSLTSKKVNHIDNQVNDSLINTQTGNKTNNQISDRIKSWLTGDQEPDDSAYWQAKCKRLECELNETLNRLDELDEDNELLECELKELLKLSKESSKLKKLLSALDI